jgi:uncharacterized protein (TIGR00730 family)
MNICVFCSSSDAVNKKYFLAAKKLGKEMVKNGYNLVYGGANRGLMLAIADSVLNEGGKVTGVIPKALHDYGISKQDLNELIITGDLRSRKSVMEKKSGAFIFLPGGIGTLEEAMEILTLKQLRYHTKPLVFLNTKGFYNKLMSFLEYMKKEKFIKKDLCRMFYMAKNEKAAIKYIKNYKPGKAVGKWF